jgi:peptidoglycan/LPS O-acetylase OafA/YrhL
MRIKEIQALRALASLLVVIYHAKLVRGGYIGVDIFYVISGYLITGLLLRELEKSRTVSFKSFYTRRIKRLLPASFFVLIVTGVIAWILYPATMRHELGKDIAAAGIYISNYLFAFWQMDYQNLDTIPPVVIHYWSLAVEEQFYLVWPFLIFILYKGGGRRLVGQGIAALTVISFLWSYGQTHTAPIWAFYSLPTRAWELGIGALLLFIPKFTQSKKILAVAALTAIVCGSLYFNDSTAFPGIAALIPVLATAVAIATIGQWPKILEKISHLRVVQWLGEISYPLYLWHWPLLVIPAVYLGRGLHIYQRALCIVLTLVLADATHRWIEQPLRLKDLSRTRVVRLAILATSISLVLGLGIYSTYSDQIHTPSGTNFGLAQVLEKPLVYNDGCHVNNGETKSGDCTYGVRGAKVKIVLFGDSHAAQWFPALEKLATQHGFELISLTKSACPGPAVMKLNTGNYKNSDCSAWRSNSYRRIAAIHPDAVIVSGMEHFEMPSSNLTRAQWWRDGESKTLANLQGNSKHLIYIVDTPQPSRDIPSCISAGSLNKCNNTQKSPAYTISGFHNINPNPWLCHTICPAILNNQVVYRDASHISVAMSRLLSSKLYTALQAAGVGI